MTPTGEPDEENQAGGSAESAAAPDQGAESTAPPSSDAPKADDPYDLLARVVESEEGRLALAHTAQLMNDSSERTSSARPAPTQAPQRNGAAATATVDRTDLERRADEGDAEAALELRNLQRTQSTTDKLREEVKTEVGAGVFAEFVRSVPAIEELPAADRIRIGTTLMEKGPAAAITETFNTIMNRGGGGEGGEGEAAQPTAEQQQERAAQNAQTALRNRSSAPDIPPASNSGGPPPIEMGRPAAEVLGSFFDWKDANG